MISKGRSPSIMKAAIVVKLLDSLKNASNEFMEEK